MLSNALRQLSYIFVDIIDSVFNSFNCSGGESLLIVLPMTKFSWCRALLNRSCDMMIVIWLMLLRIPTKIRLNVFLFVASSYSSWNFQTLSKLHAKWGNLILMVLFVIVLVNCEVVLFSPLSCVATDTLTIVIIFLSWVGSIMPKVNLVGSLIRSITSTSSAVIILVMSRSEKEGSSSWIKKQKAQPMIIELGSSNEHSLLMNSSSELLHLMVQIIAT